MCRYCECPYGGYIIIEKSPLDEETQPDKAQIVQFQLDNPGIVLFRNGLAQGCFDIKYCPMCGKKIK